MHALTDRRHVKRSCGPCHSLVDNRNTDTACILDQVCTYTVLLYKEVGPLKSMIRQHLANHEVLEPSQTSRPDTEMPNKTSSASRPSSSTDTTSSLFSYFSATNYFLLFDLFKKTNKLKLKSSKICFILSALCLFKPHWKIVAFPKTNAMTG